MAEQPVDLAAILQASDFAPEQWGARFWYDEFVKQQQQVVELQQRVLDLEEKLHKFQSRISANSSQPSSQDGDKPAKSGDTGSRKRRPKYNHAGKTRHGFGWVGESSENTSMVLPKFARGV